MMPSAKQLSTPGAALNRLVAVAGLSLCLCLSLPTQAGTGEATAGEIAHLLAFVAASDCQFERNGTVHDAKEAARHIQRKYDHVKRRIHSAEEFIRYAATQSSFTGRPYTAICQDQRIASAQWLLAELQRYQALSVSAEEPVKN